MKPGISVIVHTRNSEATLPTLLDSVSWADAVVAVDMESTDQTLAILAQAGAQVFTLHQQDWSDELRNPWLDKVDTEWTLVMDSDEHLSQDAEPLLRKLVATARTHVTAFALPRYNQVLGRVMQSARWYPDHQVRLFRSNRVRYSRAHHQPPTVTGGGVVVSLEPEGAPHLHHEHYGSLKDVVSKQLSYALTDRYPESWDPLEFSMKARDALLSSRLAVSDDERAIELVMALDHLLRGLIAWDQGGRRQPLPPSYGWIFAPLRGGRARRGKKFGLARVLLRRFLRPVLFKLQKLRRRGELHR